MSRVNLVGRRLAEICELLEPEVERSFRARQVAHWILHRHARSFAEMTNLSLQLRDRLAQRFELRDPQVRQVQESSDGARKYLLELFDGATIECVVMPGQPAEGAGSGEAGSGEAGERSKTTLCLSTQTGCAVGCRFCVTGQLGAGRNLTPDEIVGQYRLMLHDLLCAATAPERVNIVLMGMGEPLLNTSNLGTALEVLYERVSPKRITVSTAGIIPGLRWLAGLPRRPKLAVSLNAPDQDRRAELMPIAERYPLDQLMAELRRFPLERGRRITFEYVLLAGFNDQPADGRALARLLAGIPCKINVIPFNPDADRCPGLERPDEAAISAFAGVVRDAGLVVTVRRSRGQDIAGACGQLSGSRVKR